MQLNKTFHLMMEDSKKTGILYQAWLWVKDLIEVVLTVAVLIVVFRALFGSHTLVPLVVVTSGSMLHESGEWHDWLLEGVGEEKLIDSFPFQSGFARGDMIFTVSPGKYLIFPDTRLGDVVIYERDLIHLRSFASTEPIIHRVVGIIRVVDDEVAGVDGSLACLNESDLEPYLDNVKNCREGRECFYTKYPESPSYRLFITKGDNNPTADQCGLRALPVNEEQLKARGWVRLPYIGWIKLLFNEFLHIILGIVRLPASLIL